MPGFSYYVSSPEGFRAARADLLTSVTGLPAWGRVIVMLLAIPGILLISLSLLALAASIAALLLLTVPAYALLRRLVGPRRGGGHHDDPPDPIVRSTRARRVEATVVGTQTGRDGAP